MAESIAIEDSILGARSAVGAGLTTYLLTTEDPADAVWPAGIVPARSLRELVGRLLKP